MTVSWNKKLYNYGYLVTTDKEVAIPSAWDQWKLLDIKKFRVLTHPLQNAFVYQTEDISFLLIGHAYNPFTMESEENSILKKLCQLYNEPEKYQDYFDQLTGVFAYFVITNFSIGISTDCAGMMGTYYAKAGEQVYCSSHAQLIADLCGFEADPYVSCLKKYRFFKLYGWYLPGNSSPYQEIKRVIPNVETIIGSEIHQRRFYPRKKYTINDDVAYKKQVEVISHVLNNSMRLILKKWKKPAISLTGGVDSKTTLACAKSVQKDYTYFSYISLPREATDAYAAKDICEKLGLNHIIYDIDTDSTQYSDFAEVDRIVERHYSFLGKGNRNDICKRIFLSNIQDFDVEVKSWVSEIARASRYKQYSKRYFSAKPSARQLTTMYKVFLWNRRSAIQTDQLFKDYLQNSGLDKTLDDYQYPWTEFFVWEIVFGGWGGLALTGEHKVSGDITIPYNNRALIDMMLRTPLEKRITDQLHKDIIDCSDDRINRLNICVVNGNQTKLRMFCEKLYFEFHSRWPL